MSLELRNACVRLRGRVLLDNASVAVRPGRVTVIAGPNGAGKSTLLRVLSGELPPTEGAVYLDDRPLTAWSLEQRAERRAVLPQSPSLSFAFTGAEVVGLSLSLRRGSTRARDAKLVARAMADADVTHLAERNYLTMSGGEQQRTHFARTLAQIADDETSGDRPRYLLLDEPTASLDLAHQHQTLGKARTLARQGVGVLAVLHDLNLASAYADEVILVKDGRIVRTGPPVEVLTAETVGAVFACPVTVLPGPHHPIILPITLAAE